MGAINTEAILTPVKLLDANEGGQSAVDIRAYKGDCDFHISAKNDAGSSPLLDVKLRHSDKSLSHSYDLSSGGTAEDVQLRIAADDSVELAAKVVVASTIQVASIVLPLKERGTIADGTNLTLGIQTDSGGDPDGTDLSTATVALSALSGDYEGHEFVFSTPVELTADTYWLVLTSDFTASGTNNVAWKAETGLSSGGNQSIEDGTSWTADADDSQLFFLRSYAFADISGGAFAQAGTAGAIERLTINVDNLDQYVQAHSTVAGTSTPAFYAGVSITGYKEG